MSNLNTKPQGRLRAGTKGYERRDANAKWIFGIVVFLLPAGFIMHLCLAGVLERMEKKPSPTDRWASARRGEQAVAENKAIPHLQLMPPEDFDKFRAREENEMNSYGWINRTAGVVRIPVGRAMDLLLERGLPVRSQTNGAGLGPSNYQLQQQRPQSGKLESQGEQ